MWVPLHVVELGLSVTSMMLAADTANAFAPTLPSRQTPPLLVTSRRTTVTRRTGLRTAKTTIPSNAAAAAAAPASNTIDDSKIDGIMTPEEKGELAEKDKFDWFKSWYPLVPVEILDPEIPHHFTLLGMDVVVWNDGKVPGATLSDSKKKRPKNAKRLMGEWRVFEDECPHRKVPLSEGRVEDDGTLLCSYHGWRFEGKEGCLVNVPQLTSDSAQLKAVQQNPKSQCNSFPVQIIDGVLWVWPETGEDARLESALTPAPFYHIPEDNKDNIWYGPWNFRVLPYGADFFIENVVDPAHVSISHHNVVGSRYADQTMSMKHITKLEKGGFAVETSRNVTELPSKTTFKAPCHVAIEAPYGVDVACQVLELYASPSLPGFSHHVGRMLVIKEKSGNMPQLLRQFTFPLPKWLHHVLAAGFLNQDAVFLHQQERLMAKKDQYTTLQANLLKGAKGDYNQAVLPIQADKGVVFFRKWLSKFAGGVIPYKNNPSIMPDVDPQVCFDQYNSHTAYCRYCGTALRRLKWARLASFFVATCLGVLRPLQRQVVNLAAVLAAAGLGMALNKLIGMFYKYEFSHSHND